MIRYFKKAISLLALITCWVTASSQVKLPRLIRDSMVLQRDTKIKVWGWASKGENVRITFNGKSFHTRTAADGTWLLELPPMNAGGPFTMNIYGHNHISIHDILIGDVWICSGQSNMVHQMSLHSITYSNEIAEANYPDIRQFWIPTLTDLESPRSDLPTGYWKSANPQDVLQFSAVAYFFAKDINEKYHIPIGLINASVGGSPAEAWISEEGLKEFPNIIATVEKNKDTTYVNNLTARDTSQENFESDKGIIEKWYDTSYAPAGWRRINIPGYWEDQGINNLDGVVWYRRELDLPASITAHAARVFLGRIVDADFLYVNGKLVGNTTYQYPQRRYDIQTGLLKPGKNIFVIRVINYAGKGGFVPDKPYMLIVDRDTIDLKGSWEYKVGEVLMPPANRGDKFVPQYQPVSLYNAMIAPILNYGVKGFLWYQGEANASRAAQYKKLQPSLIADWRNKWKLGPLPFIYVQLPGFMEFNYLPSESEWAELRDAQLKSLSLPNTAMAVAIDLGEWNDIHPDRKKEVGDRLALAAEKIAYGDSNVVSSGPIYSSSTVIGNKIVISFTNIGTGLMTNDSAQPGEFAIAGSDKKFIWANARIDGDKVIAWNDLVPHPLFVRYAWSDDPVNPNLFNKEGLPASPFRTDEPNK